MYTQKTRQPSDASSLDVYNCFIIWTLFTYLSLKCTGIFWTPCIWRSRVPVHLASCMLCITIALFSIIYLHLVMHCQTDCLSVDLVSLPNSSFVCHPGVSLPSSTFISRPGVPSPSYSYFCRPGGYLHSSLYISHPGVPFPSSPYISRTRVTFPSSPYRCRTGVSLTRSFLYMYNYVDLVCHWLHLHLLGDLLCFCLGYPI